MKIHLADHYGMCFGVRDAIAATEKLAETTSATILGELVHNPVVQKRFREAGVQSGTLETKYPETDAVVFTAHGVADSVRDAWTKSGSEVLDTTCPLVKKAHNALESLVSSGYKPVVIGKRDHVEVRGLITDFPEAVTVLSESDFSEIPLSWEKIGIVSQTTQPVSKVEALVEALKSSRPNAMIRFIDTVCQPTKNRQRAISDLVNKCDTIVVVGGNNSNNTRQLADRSRELGCSYVIQIETAEDLESSWFLDSLNVGVTAGTSTLEETVQEVATRLEQFAAEKSKLPAIESLRAIA